jgi:hypothetical protein
VAAVAGASRERPGDPVREEARALARRAVRRLRRAAPLQRGGAPGVLAGPVGRSGHDLRGGPLAGPRGGGGHGLRAVVSRRAPQLRREPAAAHRRRGRHRRADRFGRTVDGELPGAQGAHPRPRRVARGAGRRAGRPRGRDPAERRRGRRRHARDQQPRRRLVPVRPRPRDRGRDRALRPDRAARALRRLHGGSARGSAAARAEPRRAPAHRRAHDHRRRGARRGRDRGVRRAERRALGGREGRSGRRARLRAPALRSSVLHPVHVGHDGAAQVRRPRHGRHAAPAPQGAPHALRSPARRPLLLPHEPRMEHVVLERRRARRGRERRPLGRLAAVSPPLGALRSRRRGGRPRLRDLAALPRHPARGRRGAPGDPPARHGEDHPLDRIAAVARALRLGVRPRQGGRLPLVDLGRDRDQRVLRDGQPRGPRPPGRAL